MQDQERQELQEQAHTELETRRLGWMLHEDFPPELVVVERRIAARGISGVAWEIPV
jgi:hypothetical protein